MMFVTVRTGGRLACRAQAWAPVSGEIKCRGRVTGGGLHLLGLRVWFSKQNIPLTLWILSPIQQFLNLDHEQAGPLSELTIGLHEAFS